MAGIPEGCTVAGDPLACTKITKGPESPAAKLTRIERDRANPPKINVVWADNG